MGNKPEVKDKGGLFVDFFFVSLLDMRWWKM
jgi:hypothetical protein